MTRCRRIEKISESILSAELIMGARGINLFCKPSLLIGLLEFRHRRLQVRNERVRQGFFLLNFAH